jgi:hypothetical protein
VGAGEGTELASVGGDACVRATVGVAMECIGTSVGDVIDVDVAGGVVAVVVGKGVRRWVALCVVGGAPGVAARLVCRMGSFDGGRVQGSMSTGG